MTDNNSHTIAPKSPKGDLKTELLPLQGAGGLDWVETTLGEVCIFSYGKGLKTETRISGNVPVYGSSGITGWHNEALIIEKGLIIGRKGSVGTIYKSEVPFFPIDTVFYITQKDTKCDLEYLYRLLQSLGLDKKNSDSAVPGLNRENAYSTKILLPPLQEQKAVASVFSAFDDKIELLREQNNTLEEMGQVIFQEWFGKYGVDDELPEGWRVERLGEVVEFINGYAFKSEDLLSEDTGNCYKVFKMGNIRKGGGFEESKTKSYIKKEDFKGKEKYILKQGDLLMSMTDMKDAISLLGHTALMIYDDEYVVNQRVGLIRASNDINIDFPFLYLLTNNKDFIANLRGRANSGVQINLSTEAIKSSELLIPDKKTNEKFNDIVKPMFQKIRDNSEQIQSLALSRDELLPRLMSGEVRVEV